MIALTIKVQLKFTFPAWVPTATLIVGGLGARSRPKSGSSFYFDQHLNVRLITSYFKTLNRLAPARVITQNSHPTLIATAPLSELFRHTYG